MMIPLARPKASQALNKKLADKSALIANGDGEVDSTRKLWRSARAVRRDLKILLEGMAAGYSRCMYCGDSEGTDIDHFNPIAEDVHQTFSWLNHFLACSHCNSNEKRHQYPCDGSGNCLLINPCHDDPHEHLRLTLPTGIYTGLTAKGLKSIEVFGLARSSLERGRAKAFVRCKSMLRDWANQHEQGMTGEAKEVLESLSVQPFADVLYVMLRRVDEPGAAHVFGVDVVRGLRQIKGKI